MKRVLWFLETYFTGVLMLVSSLMIFMQVILRYVFSFSIIWVEEFARYSIVWFIFLGASLAAREGKHASVDVLIRLFPPKVQKVFDVLDIVISIVFTLIIVWFGFSMVVRISQIGNITPALQIPMYIPYLAIPIGALMMTWRFLEKLLETLRAPAGRKEREAN